MRALPVPSLVLCCVALLVALLPAAAGAQELSPAEVAKIRRAEKEALGKIAAEHGNRKPHEMDNAERREVIQKQQAAQQEVLQKHGVSTRDWVNYTAKMSPEEQAQAEAAEKKLEADAQAKKAAAEKAAAQKDKPVEVQQGFGEDNPVEMGSTPGAAPKVEVGIPVE